MNQLDLLMFLAREFHQYLTQERNWGGSDPYNVTNGAEIYVCPTEDISAWYLFEVNAVYCDTAKRRTEFDYTDPELFEQLLQELDSLIE